MEKLKLLLRASKRLRQSKKKPTKQSQFLIGLLSFGLLLIIVWMIYAGWKILNNTNIDDLLPAQQTVAYIEFENFKLPSKLSQSPIKDIKIEEAVSQRFFGGNTIPEWAQRNSGIAFIRTEDEISNAVFFVRKTNRREVKRFFSENGIENETFIRDDRGAMTIFTHSQGSFGAFAFAGPYVFLTSHSSTLEVIADTLNGDWKPLNENMQYQKVVSNLPRNPWLKTYINLRETSLPKNSPFSTLLTPLKNFSNEFGFTVRKDQSGFRFNTFLSLNPGLLTLNHKPGRSGIFSYKLTEYLHADDVTVYLGGADLAAEWQNTLETISQLNPAYGIILEGIVRTQVKKIFGSEVSLRNDIYPLFEGEYALSLDVNEAGSISILLMLTHEEKEFFEVKLKKLAKGFSLLAARFVPDVIEIILPDGTISQELVAGKNKVEEVEEEYEGYTLNCTEIKGLYYGFCYTITDKLMVMANNLDVIKKTIDATQSDINALADYQPFRQTLSSVSHVSDEMSFINLEKTNTLFGKNPFTALAIPYLQSFSGATWVKHYFKDGVSSEGFILLK